jgi:glycosyltransferase involved in cell wall biosynthesis
MPAGGAELRAPEGDVAALADRVATLAAFDVERLRGLAEAGRAKIERDFNLDTELDKLARLYHRLCSAHV